MATRGRSPQASRHESTISELSGLRHTQQIPRRSRSRWMALKKAASTAAVRLRMNCRPTGGRSPWGSHRNLKAAEDVPPGRHGPGKGLLAGAAQPAPGAAFPSSFVPEFPSPLKRVQYPALAGHPPAKNAPLVSSQGATVTAAHIP